MNFLKDLLASILLTLKSNFQHYFLPRLLIFVSLWVIFRLIIFSISYLQIPISFLSKLNLSRIEIIDYVQTFCDLWVLSTVAALLLGYSYLMIFKSGN